MRPQTSCTDSLKEEQLRARELAGRASDYHQDHLVPPCVCGAPSDPRNLWPQPLAGTWTDKAKDLLEASVCRAVCRSAMTLEERQAWFLEDTDWRKAYEKFFESK